MRTLLLSDTFNGYGAERMLIRTGLSLKSFGHEIHFCSIYKEEELDVLRGADRFVNLGITRHNNLIIRSFCYYIVGGFLLYRYCKKNRINYVISFKENPLCLLLLVRCFLSINHIHSERDNPYNRDTISSKIKMKLYRFATKIVFQTEGARDFFGDAIKKKSVLIPNPVTIPDIQWSYSFAKKTIVSVARLDVRYKRQDLLLKAFSIISSQCHDWKVVFYGDGNDKCVLEQMAKDLNVYDRIIFKGKTDNVHEKIVQDGVFVLTSDTEGIPNALMEAMALGMPVITTDCEPGGARMLVENGYNGLMINRGDIDGLKNALEFSINHQLEMAEMGAKARVSMQRFSPTIIANKWNSLIV